MATIRKRGTRYQAIVRRKLHSEARTFKLKQDAELWAKQTEVSLERNSAGLLNSAKNITFADLCQSYRSRAISSKGGVRKKQGQCHHKT
jgi:hypothetical protein